MADSPDRSQLRDTARRKANTHFTATEARDEFIRHEVEKERAAFDVKTAKLKALRLAKEAADKVEQDRLDALKPPPKPRVGAKKPASLRKKPA